MMVRKCKKVTFLACKHLQTNTSMAEQYLLPNVSECRVASNIMVVTEVMAKYE